jgi:hypothetical protein
MKSLRPIASLVAALALLVLGAPLAAAICVGGGACPCPGMASGTTDDDCEGPVFAVEMSCCAIGADPATPQPSADLPGPSATAPAVGSLSLASAVATNAAARVTKGDAALASAGRRHAVGLFTLHSAFLI